MTHSPAASWTATAHSNIALIKYWGKRDATLAIPATSSLSLTLDIYPTTTTVHFDGTLDEDRVELDGAALHGVARDRVVRFLDLVRERAGEERRAVVDSLNAVPTGAGLASSASGFAALAGAATAAAGLDLDPRALSRLARRGSGSASRSIFGGLVQWNAGHDDESSFAEPLDAEVPGLTMLVAVVNAAEKSVSSRIGMQRTMDTSPFFEPWVTRSSDDLAAMRAAIDAADIGRIATIAEANALGMHATMLGAVPPFSYWEPDSVRVMGLVRRLREEGMDCGFTMDAGPNVKIICRDSDAAALEQALGEVLPGDAVVRAQAGPSIAIRLNR